MAYALYASIKQSMTESYARDVSIKESRIFSRSPFASGVQDGVFPDRALPISSPEEVTWSVLAGSRTKVMICSWVSVGQD